MVVVCGIATKVLLYMSAFGSIESNSLPVDVRAKSGRSRGIRVFLSASEAGSVVGKEFSTNSLPPLQVYFYRDNYR